MGKFAVIDIGSNSVRLVVYENDGRAPYVLFNEKVLCGLGRGVSETGNMQSDTMADALSTLRRFAILLKKMSVRKYRVVATSAVRDALNGPDFVEKVRRECRLKVEVIAGEEEGRLSGYGVLCAMPHAQGIVGDLGGGSLELVHIDDGRVFEKCTMPIGPLRFQNTEGELINNPKETIKKNIMDVDWLTKKQHDTLYLVGGSWRALAKIHMLENDYPLTNLHNYSLPFQEVMTLTEMVSKMNQEDLAKYSDYISGRRLKVLALSALVLKRLLKTLQPNNIIVSGYGLREGLVFDALPTKIKKKDPLIEVCHEIAETTGRFSEHGLRLLNWIDPLFDGESSEDRRLRLAACMLSDVGWRGHPDYRAEMVMSDIMYGRLVGVDHRGAGLIALALYVCYGGSIGDRNTAMAEALVKPEDISYANRIGLSLRMAQRVSAGTAKGLKAISLHKPDEQNLVLQLNRDKADLVNEVVMRRFVSLSKEMGLEAQLTYT